MKWYKACPHLCAAMQLLFIMHLQRLSRGGTLICFVALNIQAKIIVWVIVAKRWLFLCSAGPVYGMQRSQQTDL